MVTSRPRRVQGTSRAAQQARRNQIMRAALDLVLVEGYDGLQMRHVAAAARVSTRTLYNHFPSKEHLILAALVEQTGAMGQFLGNGSSAGRSPAKRVRDALGVPTHALQAVPPLTTAMAKALVSGQASIIPMLSEFRDAMIDAIGKAIRPTGPTKDDLVIARALQRIWFAAILAWSSGIEPPESVDQAIGEAVALLLPTYSSSR